jgi:hypothetical protein
MWERVDKFLPAGPRWYHKEVILPEAPNEPQLLFYRDPVECLQFLSENPSFDQYQTYGPVKYFTDKELKESRIVSTEKCILVMHGISTRVLLERTKLQTLPLLPQIYALPNAQIFDSALSHSPRALTQNPRSHTESALSHQ